MNISNNLFKSNVSAFSPFQERMLGTETKAEEKQEAKDNEDSLCKSLKEDYSKDVFALIMRDVLELPEYYQINKQQARNSFTAALCISILGFLLFCAGVVLTYFYKSDNIIHYSTICGAIAEFIAGIFFWLYKKAIHQMNLFHTSLLDTQKIFTAIQLVEKISPERRDNTNISIIKKLIEKD